MRTAKSAPKIKMMINPPSGEPLPRKPLERDKSRLNPHQRHAKRSLPIWAREGFSQLGHVCSTC